MAEDRRLWSQVVEDDLYAEEQERFRQWVAEHPNPLESLRAEIETLRSDNARLERVVGEHQSGHPSS